MMLIGVESVKREVDFIENKGKTMTLEVRKLPKCKRFQPMPRVQRCAEKVERGYRRCSTSIPVIKTTDRCGKST